MKVLDLHCRSGHVFEGWFASEDDFQSQLQRGLVQCPMCGDEHVQKKLSAPRLNLGAASAPEPSKADSSPAKEVALPSAQPALPQAAMAAWMQWARKVVAQTEDVGPRFVEEARKMHAGEVDERPIRGQATMKETVELLEEGIAVMPLPAAIKEPLQ